MFIDAVDTLRLELDSALFHTSQPAPKEKQLYFLSVTNIL